MNNKLTRLSETKKNVYNLDYNEIFNSILETAINRNKNSKVKNKKNNKVYKKPVNYSSCIC